MNRRTFTLRTLRAFIAGVLAGPAALRMLGETAPSEKPPEGPDLKTWRVWRLTDQVMWEMCRMEELRRGDVYRVHYRINDSAHYFYVVDAPRQTHDHRGDPWGWFVPSVEMTKGEERVTQGPKSLSSSFVARWDRFDGVHSERVCVCLGEGRTRKYTLTTVSPVPEHLRNLLGYFDNVTTFQFPRMQEGVKFPKLFDEPLQLDRPPVEAKMRKFRTKWTMEDTDAFEGLLGSEP